MSISSKLYSLASVSMSWITTSRKRAQARSNKKVHILFCMCDHYEPGTNKVNAEEGTRRVNKLICDYPRITANHTDSHGRKPKRTWFFPPHYHEHGWLKKLVSLCEAGFGEVELHLHHGKHQPDTSENLRTTIQRCIDEYSIFGIFGKEEGRIKYGFIHGDWALDNSRNGTFCGVNDEISILSQTGCYADFTFPSPNEANPDTINSIYYAIDDPALPKSHNNGVLVSVGKQPPVSDGRDLMLVEGPLHPFFRGNKLTGLRLFGDALDPTQRITPERIDAWVKTGISVQGKENWIVIKTHTHGAVDDDVVLGQDMETLFSHLEKNYRDRPGYALHYVTSREMYNIIKAAEAGETDEDPSTYRDYRVKPPRYDSSPDVMAASDTLQTLVAKTYRG